MIKRMIAFVFGPYVRPQPTRHCPTLAEMPDSPELEPRIVINLADLRRARPL